MQSQSYHAQCCVLSEISCTMLRTLRAIMHNTAYSQSYHTQCCIISEISCTMLHTLRVIMHNAQYTLRVIMPRTLGVANQNMQLSCTMLRTLREARGKLVEYLSFHNQCSRLISLLGSLGEYSSLKFLFFHIRIQSQISMQSDGEVKKLGISLKMCRIFLTPLSTTQQHQTKL